MCNGASQTSMQKKKSQEKHWSQAFVDALQLVSNLYSYSHLKMSGIRTEPKLG
jgi:hypothetical protein